MHFLKLQLVVNVDSCYFHISIFTNLLMQVLADFIYKNNSGKALSV